MRKKQKLEFKTKRKTEIAKKKKGFLIFLIALLVFGMGSMFVLLQTVHFNLANLFNGREEGTTAAQSTTTAPPVMEGNANFLVFCVSNDAKDAGSMRFIAVINTDLHNKLIRVCTFSPKNFSTVGGITLTLEEHFNKNGAEQLRKAVEIFGGITVDKYAFTNDAGFKNAMKSIDKTGSLKLSIKETINYEDKFKLFIPAGERAINGETLLNYFRYNATQGDTGLTAQAQTLKTMLGQYINTTNAANSEALFGQLVNSMSKTDINAADFSSAKVAIDMLAASKSSLTISVEQDLSLFTPADAKTAKEETTS